MSVVVYKKIMHPSRFSACSVGEILINSALLRSVGVGYRVQNNQAILVCAIGSSRTRELPQVS